MDRKDRLYAIAEMIYDRMRGDVVKKCGRKMDRGVVISVIYLVLDRELPQGINL